MKTYLSVGIGDMMCLDAVLTQEERNLISEVYWACRFGNDLIPLMENNPYYPNLKHQHTISDEMGMNKMREIDSSAVLFWHFRPDFQINFKAGLELFNIENKDLNIIDAASIFLDGNRSFTNSSFIDSCDDSDVDWVSLGIDKRNYILFHYPTSTRPRRDIASITESDWNFVESLSKDLNLKIIIISDVEINREIDNSVLLIKPNIKSVVTLCKYAKYYAGCDSFVSILCSKVLDPSNLFIKSHNPNIQNEVKNNVWLQRFFLPHDANTISTFYKNYIG
jgi:hypothetical protein